MRSLTRHFLSIRKPPGPDAQQRGATAAVARRERRRGAVLVEFAMVVPVFILFLFGMIEFGRMVMVGQLLTNAAREGCRVAVLPGGTDQECKDTISNYLSSCLITGYNTPTVSPAADTAASGTSITVTVSVPLNNASWAPLSWLQGKSLTGKVVMIKE